MLTDRSLLVGAGLGLFVALRGHRGIGQASGICARLGSRWLN